MKPQITESSNIFDLGRVAGEVATLRDEGRTIVQCHGVFDLFHHGHLEHLMEASRQGDVLVVTVTPDQFVNKGPGRPVYTQVQRAAMLDALSVVDFVAITSTHTAVEAIRALKPSVFVKGPDYSDEASDVSGNISREREALENVGGRMHITKSPTMSSSALINSYASQFGDETKSWLRAFSIKHAPESAVSWLDLINGLKVLVVGEAIIDEYVRCEALGKSSKDPVLAFRELSLERQAGGSVAIAGHCAGLGAQVFSLFRAGTDTADIDLLRSAHTGINFQVQVTDAEPTVVKRRYIDDHTEARVFETYVMSEAGPNRNDDEEFTELLIDLCQSVDLVLVADYGHGLMSAPAIEAVCQHAPLLAVNTQSNAGNRGFNTVSRYPRTNFVCLNGSEVALELRRRHLSMDQLVPELLHRTGAQRAVVTEGSKGLAISDEDLNVRHCPAFALNIRDRVGAGDALYATTALLFAVGAPLDVAGFFGNLAGAAAVAELGNRSYLSSANLKRHAMAILK